jgi:threonyl-tRNA synthetase
MVYKNTPKSYRDLPVRIAELGGMFRYEASGALTGLERVRNMCLNDAHLFVRPDQIREEFLAVLDLVKFAVEKLELDINYFRLSLRDPENKEKYFDDDQMWDNAEDTLRSTLQESGLEFIEAKDEAAFYGPKLDIQIKTALGHDVTLSTIQLDFLMPQRFDLTYKGADGELHRPVVIHRGIISTMERMTATLLEQYKGAFPLWLSPIQLNVIPVSNDIHGEYAQTIRDRFNAQDIRITVDNRDEKMNKKIRESQITKIPYTVIVGDTEMNNNTVTVRPYSSDENTTYTIEEFEQKILDEIKTRFSDRKNKN